MYILFFIVVIFHEAIAEGCPPPVISKVFRTNNTWTDASGIQRNSYQVNITAGSVAITSLTLALEATPGASITSVWNMTALTSPFAGVYKLPPSRASGLPARQVHSFGFIVAGGINDPMADVHLLTATCTGAIVTPQVTFCDDPSNSATCLTVMGLEGTGNATCYSLFSYFNNKASSVNLTCAEPNVTCLILYDRQDCTGSYTTYGRGFTSLIGAACDNTASSFIFGSSCSDITPDGILLDVRFYDDYGFPYQYGYFDIVLPEDYEGTVDTNVFNVAYVYISAGIVLDAPNSKYLGDLIYRVFFQTAGCGRYTIRVAPRGKYIVDSDVYYFTVREKPAPLCCDIYQANATCRSTYIASAGIEECPIKFCCSVNQNTATDKLDVLAYDTSFGCPENSNEISQITQDGKSLTFCQRDNTNTYDTAYAYACKASLIYDPDAKNCDGTAGCYDNPPPICDGQETTFIFAATSATPYAYASSTSTQSKIHMCCSKPPPVKPAFQLGHVYTYEVANRQTLNTKYPCGTAATSPGFSIQNVNITAQVHILPVCVKNYWVTSTMAISNFKCNATIVYKNGTQTRSETFLNDGPCLNASLAINDRTGDKYFYFTQNVNTGEITDVWYASNQLGITQARVSILQWFEFKISPRLIEFENQAIPNGGFKRSTTKQVNKAKRALVEDFGWSCWYRELEDKAGTIDASGYKKICINDYGLQTVESSASYSLGTTTSATINQYPNVIYYDGVPDIYGNIYSYLNMKSIAYNTASAVTSRGFNNHEVYEFESLIQSKRSVRKEPLNWDGFTEEIFSKPEDMDAHIKSIMQTSLQSPNKSDSFASLAEIIEKYPTRTKVVIKEYLDSNPNGSESVDKLIIGALAYGFTSELEDLFLYLLQAPFSEKRKALVLYAVGLIRGDRVTVALLKEMQARAFASESESESYISLNALSIMAGQMHNARREEKALPLVDMFEDKLLESEIAGDETGILHSLTALGNSHSRQGAPHLIRYLDPKVQIPSSMNDKWRINFNKAAAQGLAGIEGTDISDILVQSLYAHGNTTEVTKSIKKSLHQRSQNAKHLEKRLLYDANLNLAKWNFDQTWGNDKGSLHFFAATDWTLSLESTYVEGIVGLTGTIYGQSFQMLDAGAFIGTRGYTAFNLHLFFFLQIPTLFGGTWTYAVLNYAISAGRQLPIKTNTDICTPTVDETAPTWTGQFSLPTLPIRTFTYRFLKYFTAAIVITADLSISYDIQADFKNDLFSSRLSEIQLTATILPAGQVNGGARVIGGDGKIVSAGAKVELVVARLSVPLTYAVLLDGSQTCKRHEIQLEYLRGRLSVYYSVPALCQSFWFIPAFITRNCENSYDLASWDGGSYFRVLNHTSCCGGGDLSDRRKEVVPHHPKNEGMQERARVGRGPLFGQVATDSSNTFNINGPNNDLTSVTWQNIYGADRPTHAVSNIGPCPGWVSRRNGQSLLPGAVSTDVASGVKTDLTATGDYDTSVYAAGHILAASLGGSNKDTKNFFIQNAKQNSGAYSNDFEQPVRQCLCDNPTYKVQITMSFRYSALALLQSKTSPEWYRSEAKIMYLNGTLVARVGSKPEGCETGYWARTSLTLWDGQAHIAYEANN